MKSKFISTIYIALFLLITNSVFAAEDNNNLINCLSTQSEEIEKKTEKSISIALKCMTSYVSEVDKKIEIEEIKKNLKLLPQYQLIDSLSLGSNFIDTKNNYNKNFLGLPINSTELSNYYFRFLDPAIQMPGMISQATEDDGDGNVFYGSGVDGGSGDFYNSAFGYRALYAITSGDNNVAMGYRSLYNNTSGSDHVAIGYKASYELTTATQSTAVGYEANYSNTTGYANTAFGYQSGYSISTGNHNTSIGHRALRLTTTGQNNVGLGMSAGQGNTTGSGNTAIGSFAMQNGNNNGTGSFNTIMGLNAGFGVNGNASSNTMVGQRAGYAYSTTSYNTYIGAQSGENAKGGGNTSLGYAAMKGPFSGSSQNAGQTTAIGYQALGKLESGNYNTAIGSDAGYNLVTGSSNVMLGYQAGMNETGNNKLYISNSSSNVLIYGDFNDGLVLLGRNGEDEGGVGVRGNKGIIFYDADGSNTVSFKTPSAVSSNITFTLPGADGSNGQVLSTNGSGTLSWANTGSSGSFSEDSGSLNNVFFGSGTCTDCDDSDGYGANVAFGFNALSSEVTFHNADEVHDTSINMRNHAFGYETLKNNSAGGYNHAFGYQSMYSNTLGYYNSAFGARTLYSNTTGDFNSAFGSRSLYANTTGSDNTGFGNNTLNSNTTGNQNTAIGRGALVSNTTASNNVGVGYSSLYANTTGTKNIAVGSQALLANTTGSYNIALADSLISNTTGNHNQAAGSEALYSNTTGSYNTGFGSEALRANTTGSFNIGFGFRTLDANTIGEANMGFGSYALSANTTGNYNSASGYSALFSNTTGNANSASGFYALYSNTTGSYNGAFGYRALYSNTTGSYNFAAGRVALTTNTTGDNNVAMGDEALTSNTTASYGIAFGSEALKSNTTGTANTGLGFRAGYSITTGAYNTSIGYKALYSNVSGSKNFGLGYEAGYFETGSNKLYIANSRDASGTLVFGDFSTGDMTIGKSAGVISIGNDLYVKGNLYVAGSTSNSAPGSVGTQPVFSGISGITPVGNLTGKMTAYMVCEVNCTEDDASSAPASVAAQTVKQVATNTAAVRKVKHSIGQHAAALASNTSALDAQRKTISSMQSSFNKYQLETNQQFTHMETEYSRGIASAIAIGQINPAAEGFSFGAGFGSFNGEQETAFGLGYGTTLTSGAKIKFTAGKNGEASGGGVMISF